MSRKLFAVALLLAAAPVLATETTPNGFVTALYRAYQRPDTDILGRDANKIFSPRLLALIRADKAPDGEIGKLDYDPICACQDADGLQLLAVSVTPSTATSAHATSKFRISATTKSVDLSLVKTPAGWRVDDVSSDGKKGLRAYLEPGKRTL